MKVVGVVGARPNFVKMAPLLAAMEREPGLSPVLVHTGQHYDVSLAGQFFQDLALPAPAVSLEVGSGSHAYVTAEVMRRLEPVLVRLRPDLVLVVGDVNSTLAAALTAAKLRQSVAHVEAGLRSFDREMPEEINRIVTDVVSDHLFVSEESGRVNLLREGVTAEKIHMVGNVMIDALELYRPRWTRSTIADRLGLAGREYGVVTLHRPSNVDAPGTLRGLVEVLADIGRVLPLIFPVHPRTWARLLEWPGAPIASGEIGEICPEKGLWCVPPLGYLDFVALVATARLVLTDSGGLQEETTALGVPCLTLRENTERPITVSHGTNRVIGIAPERIAEDALRVLAEPPTPAPRPPLWDGRAAERIARILAGRPR